MITINLFIIFPLISINGLLLLNGAIVGALAVEPQKPNVIIIMADDMGFDDVSFRGSNRFLTPNIDALAYSGIILNNLYTAPMCSPSRSALLTGKYPIHTGMQHFVIQNDEPWSLPTNEVTMAELFQSGGYFTSLIGKWHLGMSRKNYTPTERGFDHFFGYLGAYIDYWDHNLLEPDRNYSRGHDLKKNLDVVDFSGMYATDLFTQEAVELIRSHNASDQPLFMLLSHLAPHVGNEDAELQAPQLEVSKFKYMENEDHRVYAAMMSILDKSVGKVVEALAEKEILNNTIILFLSDNGGPTLGPRSTGASNYPLRGQKNSPWEGALRSSGVIWYKEFEKRGVVWNQRIYIGDLLKTLMAASFIDIPNELSNEMDGLNLWIALKYGYQAVEREIVHNIDEIENYVSYMKGKWKYINGSTLDGEFDYWMGLREPSRFNSDVDPRSENYADFIQNTTVWQIFNPNQEEDATKVIQKLRAEAAIQCQLSDPVNGVACNPLEAPCLFDLDVDPCEQNNLYERMKSMKVFKDILDRVEHFRETAHPINNLPSDSSSNPKYYNNEWTWWQDIQDEGNSASSSLFLRNLSHLFLILYAFVVYLL